MKYLVAVLMFASLGVAACGDDGESLDSGIEGQVLAGPQCPVVQDASPCPDEPIVASIDVLEPASGERVIRFSSDADGRFRVDLAPGQYRLDPLRPSQDNPFPVGEPQTVTVDEGEYAEIVILYDTGIR
jgi:hypothetical protein